MPAKSRVVEISGLPRLYYDRVGTPPVVRWARVLPSGTIRVHESENRVGYSHKERRSVQWRLVCDIAAAIDPAGLRSPGEWHEARWITDVDELDAMLIEPWMPEHTRQPVNPTVARMMRHVEGMDLDVRGTCLFLGHANDRGLHASLTDEQVKGLWMLAAESAPDGMPPALVMDQSREEARPGVDDLLLR